MILFAIKIRKTIPCLATRASPSRYKVSLSFAVPLHEVPTLIRPTTLTMQHESSNHAPTEGQFSIYAVIFPVLREESRSKPGTPCLMAFAPPSHVTGRRCRLRARKAAVRFFSRTGSGPTKLGLPCGSEAQDRSSSFYSTRPSAFSFPCCSALDL